MILLLCSPAAARSEATPFPSEDIGTLVSSAVADNPELKSSESRWQMFVGKAKQASALEDPMFMFKLQNMMTRQPFVFNRDPQSAMVFGISQQFPFWGKRALRKEIALNESESYRWAFEERKLELARMVKETSYKLWAVDKELEIIGNNLKILDNFVTIAGLKYSTGQGAQQDIIRAGLEKSKMLAMQINLKQQRRSLEANLNYLLYRPSETPVGHIPDFTLPHITLSAGKLIERAIAHRPQVKSLASLAAKAEADLRLARKELYPDFNLSFEYMLREPVSTAMITDPGYNMFSVGLTFNLPFRHEKRQAMIAESTAETAMATDELNALKNNISYTVNETLSQIDRLKRTMELYGQGIIPQAKQSVESSLIGYRAGKTDYLAILEAIMNLLNYQGELYDSRADYMMKFAQLEAALGTDPAASPEEASKPMLKDGPAARDSQYHDH